MFIGWLASWLVGLLKGSIVSVEALGLGGLFFLFY